MRSAPLRGILATTLASSALACAAAGSPYSLELPDSYRANASLHGDALASGGATEIVAARGELETSRRPDTEWWRGFGAPELDRWIERGLRANRELEAGVARVAQARAALRSDRSALAPQLGLSGSGSGERTRRDPAWRDHAASSLGLSYELDLFGANRSSVAGSQATLERDAFAQNALALAVQGDIAEAYFGGVALRERLEVARRNLRAAEQVHALVVTRHAEGAASGFDRARQASALAAARARVPALELEIEQNEHALAVLVGVAPQRFELADPTFSLSAVRLPSIDAGVPSELLVRRPDLAASEAGLRAADADIAVARAAFLPRFDLGGALTGAALTGTSDLVTSLSAGLTAPIFRGGRLRAELSRSQERRKELLANYRGDILQALREVEDALVAIRVADEREAQLAIASRESERAFELALVRYREGATDLLDVLDAQQRQLDARDGHVQATLDRIAGRVRLFRALGGGWQRRSST